MPKTKIKIKPKAYSRLTQALYNNFTHRKQPNLFSVLVNVKTGLIYPVPLGIEHIHFACWILKINLEEFQEYRQEYLEAMENLVPSNIEIEPITMTVTGMITGVCGLELGLKIRHTKQQLKIAHALTKKFIRDGDFKIKLRIEEIIYKFAKKTYTHGQK